VHISDVVLGAELAAPWVGGQVVPEVQLTLAQLAEHDGTNPAKPLYLSVQGTIYDVRKGKNFYGPDGEAPRLNTSFP
jgi:Cytochrome b5-like Heme/Steroid binding domain